MRTSWPGGFGLDVLYPPSTTIEYLRIEFDLVCVHGLNGDPAHTWFGKGANGKKICWLSDLKFLPNQFPLSRIVTFKYNSRVVNYKSDAQLEAIASSLLCQLEGKRRSSEVRD
jgi:hypothetical protein